MSFKRWTVKTDSDLVLAENTAQLLKGTSYWCMQLPRELCRVKIPIPKGYILCDVIYITLFTWRNCRNREQSSGGQRKAVGEVGGAGLWLLKGDPCDDGSDMCFECINTNVLVVMLYYSSAHSSFWGNWVTGLGVFCIFLTTAYESTVLSK